jgi:hypothetical protein
MRYRGKFVFVGFVLVSLLFVGFVSSEEVDGVKGKIHGDLLKLVEGESERGFFSRFFAEERVDVLNQSEDENLTIGDILKEKVK